MLVMISHLGNPRSLLRAVSPPNDKVFQMATLSLGVQDCVASVDDLFFSNLWKRRYVRLARSCGRRDQGVK